MQRIAQIASMLVVRGQELALKGEEGVVLDACSNIVDKPDNKAFVVNCCQRIGEQFVSPKEVA